MENKWDKLLGIKTTGRDDSQSDQYRYPYEPTPYSVLERLANAGYIRKKNVLIDYGCGKGRVGFFLSYQVRCRSIGIEYDERIYQGAMKNLATSYIGGKHSDSQMTVGYHEKVAFFNEDARKYKVPPEVDRFYFFNPFSVEILQSVIERIRESYYEHPRQMFLFFYYPSDEYISYLMTVDELIFEDEIDCRDLFDGGDDRERIVVFGVSTYAVEKQPMEEI